MSCIKKFLIVATVFCFLANSPVRADLPAKVVQEATEFVLKKFGKKALSEGTETFAKKFSASALRHGDDVIHAVRRVGPSALSLADEAGEQAPDVLRLLTKHGDDAAVWVARRPVAMKLLSKYGDEGAEVLIKHKGLAEPLLEQLGEPAVKALGKVGPQGGRRLAMMADAGELAALGQTNELMKVVSRYGDPAMDFIWKNKGPLAVGTSLTAFLANPEGFINGGNQLVSTVAETTVKPIVQETGRAISGLIWAFVVLIFGVPGVGVYLAAKHPKAAGEVARTIVGGLRNIRRP